MSDRYEKIRQALEMGPTPGPYTAHDGNGCGCGQVFSTTADTIIAAAIGARHESYTCGDGLPDEQVATNAGYFAALDPDTIRALLAECDALRARVQELEIEREAQRSCAIYWMDQEDALRHDLRKVMDSRNAEVNALESLRASIAALAEKWMEQQAAYPNSEEGKHAAAAVRLCATELRKLGEGNGRD